MGADLKVILFGDRGFEQAVRKYSADLYRYAYWLCRDQCTAQDLVQASLERAWRSWAARRDPAATKSWLYAIIRNEHLRGFGRKRLEVEMEDADAPVDFKLDVAIDVRRALRLLPPSLQEPLLMQVLGGFSCSEIAAALDTTEGAVMTRLTRARQALRRVLEGGDAMTGVGR